MCCQGGRKAREATAGPEPSASLGRWALPHEWMFSLIWVLASWFHCANISISTLFLKTQFKIWQVYTVLHSLKITSPGPVEITKWDFFVCFLKDGMSVWHSGLCKSTQQPLGANKNTVWAHSSRRGHNWNRKALREDKRLHFHVEGQSKHFIGPEDNQINIEI